MASDKVIVSLRLSVIGRGFLLMTRACVWLALIFGSLVARFGVKVEVE